MLKPQHLHMAPFIIIFIIIMFINIIMIDYVYYDYYLKRLCYRGGSRIFFRRGCTRLLFYFNTNKSHSFFSQNTSCIRKPQVISGGGGRGVRTPVVFV